MGRNLVYNKLNKADEHDDFAVKVQLNKSQNSN